MAEQAQQTTTESSYVSSYGPLLERFRSLALSFAGLPMDNVYNAFMRAGYGMENLAPLQNQRVKALNPLPYDYSKTDLNEFLREPANSEIPLRQIAEGLRWTTYPLQKLCKSYADMLTFRNYVYPLYFENKDNAEYTQFIREWRLVDKIVKSFYLENEGQTAAHQALLQGKVFYTYRAVIDKAHNQVGGVFIQQLPSQYTRIIGLNNISRYTVSFDMMYFLQPGTDYTQFGDLFEPFVNDFMEIFESPKKANPKYVYASKNSRTGQTASITINGVTKQIYLDQVNESGAGQPRVFMQNGRWCYYVSLPINRVWTFEIDSSTAIVASPFSGLFQTLAQQAKYEAAQLSLIMNPLIKIFTGEIPYNKEDAAKPEDAYKLSISGKLMFETFWNNLMAMTNTGGTAFYMAPVENIKSHDYGEAANANKISSEFLNYEMSQTGMTALIPSNDSPHQGVAEYSAKLEEKFCNKIYGTFIKMINNFLESLNLKYGWRINIFGSVYSDDLIRANALKQIDKGDLSQHFILAALDGISVLDRLSMSNALMAINFTDKLVPPKTSYTMSGSAEQKSANSGTSAEGAPTKTETEIKETKTEKQTAGVTAE